MEVGNKVGPDAKPAPPATALAPADAAPPKPAPPPAAKDVAAVAPPPAGAVPGRALVFPQAESFTVPAATPTLSLSGDFSAAGSGSFMSSISALNASGGPKNDGWLNAGDRARLQLDTRYFSLGVARTEDIRWTATGITDAYALAAQGKAVADQYNDLKTKNDTAGLINLLPKANEVIDKVSAFQAHQSGMHAVTLDADAVGRVPLPNLGPLKDLMLAIKGTLSVLPANPGSNPNQKDYPDFKYLMERLDYGVSAPDASRAGAMGGTLNVASQITATSPTAPLGAGLGFGFSGVLFDRLRLRLSVDHLVGYMPGKVETWQKTDNMMAKGASYDPSKGYTKLSEQAQNVYATFKPPEVDVAFGYTAPWTKTQFYVDERITPGWYSATFGGVQQPLGPVDVAAGYGYRTDGMHQVTGGLGFHFSRQLALRTSFMVDPTNPKGGAAGHALFEWAPGR